ncbi:epoxyqueuosine reductase QueH [Desulfovirgula thermocuniculi]|uniref:epoxyqueuosine reductase QueH n=1 Tax=Desulfovirgula thermocuniculi TaxID=348842 RepID=UPI00041BA3B9|nr:epoxyqueuosine reductase QueH [Desulfovirgula thermocuniculi]
MRILLHICCAPCAIYPVDFLRREGHGVHGYFFNPNIHPYTEWERRKAALQRYAEEQGLPVIYEPEYRPEDYLRLVVFREAQRCQFCYALRLGQAVRVARRGGFEAFTTTLLVSPYQKHETIREIGQALGEEYGVPFYYVDFRPGYKEAVARSREMGLYRQQYCGCLFSEKERYCRRAR